MKYNKKIYQKVLIAALSLGLMVSCSNKTNTKAENPSSNVTSIEDTESLSSQENDVTAIKVDDNILVEGDFSDWSEDSKTITSLKSYVEDVINPESENFIPIEDRIVVFDMDGTLYGELAPIYIDWWMYAYRVLDDPNFKADEEMKKVGEEIRKAGETREIPETLEKEHSIQNARAFNNMTVDEYRDYVKDFLKKDAVGFKNMTYADATYKPMIQLVKYLQDNNFKTYICSGTDRDLCRVIAQESFNIPEEEVIGMDVFLEGKDQDGTDGLDYEMEDSEEVVRSDKLIIKNVKMNKVSQIAQEIGRKPVLSFGNSSGDTSMAKYVVDDNPYKAEAYMLIANDDQRDYGNLEKAKEKEEKWNELGFNVISMKDEFRTIYGDDVVKLND